LRYGRFRDYGMAVETKKWRTCVSGRHFGDQIKSWPDRIKVFYNDVRSECARSLRVVEGSTATTTVVVITVFIFAATSP